MAEEAGHWLEEPGTTLAFVLVICGAVGLIAAGLVFVSLPW